MTHVNADRVKDTTTTTGTGSITLANAAPTGFRTLNAVASTNDTFAYCIDGGAEWEVGVGTYSGSHVFARTLVLASSNSNNAVNFSAGTKTFFVTLPAADAPKRNNLTATSAPTVNDDSGDGYAVGSYWLWAERGVLFQCYDATAGAAVWAQPNDFYPPGIYAQRIESWFASFSEQAAPSNGQWFGAGRWNLSLSGTGTLTRVNAGAGRPAARASSTANNYAFAFVSGSGSNIIQDIDGPASYRLKTRVQLRSNGSAAPDATDDYMYSMGATSSWSNTVTAGGNYALFAYRQSGGVAIFESRTRRASGTAEVTTLTSPSADTWYTLEVVVTSASVKFYVNGSLVATHTTVPDGAMYDGFRCGRVAGTNARSQDVLFMAAMIDWGADA